MTGEPLLKILKDEIGNSIECVTLHDCVVALPIIIIIIIIIPLLPLLLPLLLHGLYRYWGRRDFYHNDDTKSDLCY